MSQKQARLRVLERHIARLDRRLTNLEAIAGRFSLVRLAVFLGGAIIAATLYYAEPGWAVVSLVPWLGTFAVVVRYHRLTQESISRHQVWRDIKAAHAARMKLDWAHIPAAPDPPPDAGHPILRDLDLTGRYSLHRLVDTNVSQAGSRRLLDWLTATEPDLSRIYERQKLVKELIPLTTFRDKLQLNAKLALEDYGRWGDDRLLGWLKQPAPPEPSKLTTGLLTALGILTLALLILFITVEMPPYFLLSFLVYGQLYIWRSRQMGDLFGMAFALYDPLKSLQSVFGYLETYRYGKNSLLRQRCAPFLSQQHRPSTELKRVTRVLSAASVRNNPYLWFLLNLFLPWDFYVGYLLGRRKAVLGELLPQWLDRWFELEALCALATLAHLNPGYTFPTIIPLEARPTDQPIFETRALGHPLIPDDERVCNDFTIQALGELAMITGSNMAGKSTFLRTLGVNLCLAYAGGPVNARALTTIPLRIFTCIRVTDSVTDGISYFYAEVKRLKALLSELEADHPLPLFFLIDEIFRGTNNRERLAGSRAYIRTLVGQYGTGVLSTHDLELVQLSEEIPQIKNYHFAETIEDGRMSFDYKLQPGPCPTTNALKIMQMEGLPVG